jgi:hypothetical protein
VTAEPVLIENWAGRGFSRPGPDPQAETPGARPGDCPLCLWDGPGHSAPFRECEGDREREAG